MDTATSTIEPPTPTALKRHTIDKQTLRKLMQPSLFQWSVRTAGDWLLVAIPIAIVNIVWDSPWRWPAMALALVSFGIAQHRLALMAHEGSHRAASRNRRFNDFLTGMFCLWPFANPVGGYRRFHFNHHRYLNTEGDPELHHKQKSAPAWDLPAGKKIILRRFLEDICLFHGNELLHLAQNARPGTSKIDRLLPSGWWVCNLGVIAYFGQWWILPVWFLSTAVVFWPIFRLRIWTEHIGTHDVHRLHIPWYLRYVLVPHNTWYHYEHHHFPQVPCWNLPQVRRLIGPVPEILPLYTVIKSFDHAPNIGSGVPTRVLGEELPKFNAAKVAEIPEEWEPGRQSGAGAGTGGEAIFHGEDEVRAHSGV